MKTKITVLATALMIGAAAFADTNDEQGIEYKINAKASKVIWTGSQVGKSHTGTINIASGTISAPNKIVTGAKIVMDMNTISNSDMKDAGYKAKLEGHLKSDDFFAVEKFPQAVLEITEFTPIKNATEGASNYTISGDLTIKGITHAISFPGLLVIEGSKIAATGTLTFDRSQWDVQFGSGSFFEGLGDHLIYDDIELQFQLVAVAG